MGDLAKKLKFTRGRGTEVGELWAVRLNSGKFGVKWDRTKRVLEQCGMDLMVVGPEEEEDEGGKGKKGKKEKEQGAPINTMSAAIERVPETKPPAMENEASEPKAADEAETSPIISKKRKKPKAEPQVPEAESKASPADSSKAEDPAISSIPTQPRKHKKSKREPDEPKSNALVESSGLMEKKRRKRDAEPEHAASTEWGEKKKKKKEEKSKTDRSVE